MPEIELVTIGPEELSLPKLEDGSSYIVYRQNGLRESAIHPFVRIVPALGLAMQDTALPLNKVEKAASAIAIVIDMVTAKNKMKRAFALYELLTK